MGLNTRGGGGSNTTYINIYQGNMVLEYSNLEDLQAKLESLGVDFDDSRVEEGGKTGFINVRQRTKGRNEGKDVFYYILFDVSGLITGVKLTENDFGEFFEVEFTDVDEKFVVSLGDVSSRMTKDFIRRMGNIDLSNDIVFGVWNITAEEADNGKSKSGVRMYQDDEKLEYFISYEDMPEPEQKKKGRKTVWDFSDQENFLYDALIEWKDENFKPEDVEEEAATKPEKPTRNSRAKKGKKDDLPF